MGHDCCGWVFQGEAKSFFISSVYFKARKLSASGIWYVYVNAGNRAG